ncbi:basic leucine zipper 61-like [Nicotiana tomentosiformis]|uniref:basic leucine zipper 61-like n=1 Tax=Nicotiana tomentosiformis TaxID=4098 RepID=UPI00051AB3E3|nr:basic leucine zipper 61-like [Nicotiana tomentosiformis]XP_018634283.1 basic leucine zipper 61-like [Nicotiana tomentosiformis]XP_018634284.1 basic leucine zipper 61-like [Nicotiana tomentosiformis]XP_033508245.1 basic leucine zipper 61-like [Nicotiana tomentosiformis]
MAHLPPRIPNMTSNWPDFSHHHQKIDTTTTAAHNPSWVDEFLDFSSTKRGSHRRSISDSIAFLEAPMVEECRRLSTPGKTTGSEFERFDDEQLMSMFNDDIANNPSSPSDNNSINEEKKMSTIISTDEQEMQQQQQQQLKTEPEEVESSCKSDEQTASDQHATADNNSSEKINDPKRIKRILANRQSAQRSRVRKLQYISELERSVTTLQAEVSVLSPRVAFLDHQRLVLNVDNSVLKQRIAALAQDKIFKDAHQEALKREIERLRQIYYQQNLKKMEDGTPTPQSKSQQTAADAKASEQKEQLVN